MKKRSFLLLTSLLILFVCACGGRNVHVEGGASGGNAGGAILIGTDF